MSKDLFARFVRYEPISKGLSNDEKYYAKAADGQQVFLRISDISQYDRKKADYDMMEHAYLHGVSTPKPLEFGICDERKSCYSLSGWIDGGDAEKILPHMSKTEQYELGLKAGKVLKKIHAIAAADNAEPWNIRFEHKLQGWFDKYKSNPQLHSDIGDMLVCYLKKYSHVLAFRPQTFIHGDYNIENILVMANGEISSIDFNSYNTPYGDPWWDLNNMAWMPVIFPHFYTGQLKGYFDGEPPKEFWYVLLYYLAYDALAALTDPYGLNGIEDGTEIVNNILTWTNNMQSPVPTWYLKDLNK